MQYRVLGRTGLKVSVFGYGAAPAGYLGVEQHQVDRIMDMLGERGVNIVDVAECYADAEATIGQALRHQRDRWVIVTKCGHAVAGDVEQDWSPSLLRRSIDRSLQRLRTEVIDIMLLHSCSLEVLQRGEAVEALVQAREAGKVRHIGYSGDNEAALFAAGHREMAVLEVSVNICDQRNLQDVAPMAAAANVGVIAKRPLANAAWKPLTSQPGLYAEYAATYSHRFVQMMQLISADVDVSDEDWPEVALRFAAFSQGVHTAVAGSTRAEHLAANLEAIEKGPLDASLQRALVEAFGAAEAASGEAWLGQT